MQAVPFLCLFAAKLTDPYLIVVLLVAGGKFTLFVPDEDLRVSLVRSSHAPILSLCNTCKSH